MAMEYNNLSSTNDINDAEFDRAYADSVSSLDGGAYPWNLHPSITSAEDKKAHIRSQFDALIENSHGGVFDIRIDGHLVFYGGTYQQGTTLYVTMCLVGRDVSGSKSFVHSDEWSDARNAYWDTMGIDSWTWMTTGGDTPIVRHARNRLESAIKADVAFNDVTHTMFSSPITTTDIVLSREG